MIWKALDPPGEDLWLALREAIGDESRRDRVEALRPPAAKGTSLLRLIDVATWMLHSQSRNARAARIDAGLGA